MPGSQHARKDFLSDTQQYKSYHLNIDKIPMYHLEDMLYLSTSEGMNLMSGIGHPFNGNLLEEFKINYPTDINKRIVKYLEDNFHNLP